jgi:predicted Zn finger-like uncharacterized protein
MSLVTRCPECATTFKVVKDQLRVSDGWVRCGRCGEVFDATLDLRDAPEPAAPPPPPPPLTIVASEAPPPKPEHFRDQWPAADLLSLSDAGDMAMRSPAPAPRPFPEIDLSLRAPQPPSPVMVRETVHDTARDGSAADDGVGRAPLRKAAPADDPPPVAPAASKPAPAPAPDLDLDMDMDMDMDLDEPSSAVEVAPFLDDDGGVKDSSRRRTMAWRVMAMLVPLGIVLLLGQVIHQERDRIAARQPALQSALASTCRLLGCVISPLRQIDDIKVDGASFAREKGDEEGYSFSFTLRNTADVPLAMPAVELSLLDTQERPVVRRVLMPAEFGAPTVLPARSERSASLSLSLTGPGAAALSPVVGFRVEALYP